jgi:assimilatory nitrate reductase catalytic subunit
MATLVVQPESITEQFGPHLSKSTGMRLDPGVVPDKVVETHCCFCGQQCGIQLLVKDKSSPRPPRLPLAANQEEQCPHSVNFQSQTFGHAQVIPDIRRHIQAGALIFVGSRSLVAKDSWHAS